MRLGRLIAVAIMGVVAGCATTLPDVPAPYSMRVPQGAGIAPPSFSWANER